MGFLKVAKIILGKEDISISESAILIDAPRYKKDEEEQQSGPTKEEIENKIDLLKREFEKYKKTRETEFEEWKKEEIKKHENEAFDIVKKSVEEFETKIAEANIKYNRQISTAKEEGDKITKTAMDKISTIQEEASKDGYAKGKYEGYEAGFDWAKKAIRKLNIVLSSLAREQTNLIFQARRQIAEIVVIMARKIVNLMVESQPRVVYDNIMSVLKNLKGRAEIIIRVNSEDVAQVTKHKREFLQAVEGIEKIKIAEDNTIDKGGCIIETEYGEIDSRITVQMEKVEKLIKDILRDTNVPPA